MFKLTDALRALSALALVAFMAGCANDGTSPNPSGRNLGILQLEGGAASVAQTAGNSGSSSGPPISWDVPPGAGTLFPPEVLQAPAAVIAGFPFPVTVFTVGPNGCWSPDGIEVEVDSGPKVVDLVPWDLHSGADACTMIFGYMAHDTIVTLSEPGQWTLRVEGRRIRGDGTTDGSVRAERSILVFPPSDLPAPTVIQLSPGQEILVEGSVRLSFFGVESDSRCPVDVQCVWQGNAAVRIDYSVGGDASSSVILNTGVEPAGAEVEGYRISLLALDPHPRSTMGIPASSYRATLRIDPLSTP
jgi:hypothetical protein